MTALFYALLGMVSGTLGGFFGIGGAIILIPALVYIFGFTQHQAQGTALAALLPPVGLLAVLKYYYSGNVKINVALFICLGFILGALIGANFAQYVPNIILKRGFGIFLLCVAMYMLFGK